MVKIVEKKADVYNLCINNNIMCIYLPALKLCVHIYMIYIYICIYFHPPAVFDETDYP